MFKKGLLCCFVLLLLTLPALAQDQAVLSLTVPSTELQTGQEYEVAIRIDSAPAVWSMNVEISYDPDALYVMGTLAGSPVEQGDFFSPVTSTVGVRNFVQNNRIIYTVSMLAPAESVSGGGVIGTFRVYPLSAGQTTLIFSQAEVTNIRRETAADGGESIVTDQVAFAPILLDLNVVGDTVAPPEEIVATPTPTSTVQPNFTGEGQPTAVPTLVNLPAAPVQETTPAAVNDTSPLLIVAIVVLVGSGLGLVIILVMWRRRR